jgi:hypothetical protein
MTTGGDIEKLEAAAGAEFSWSATALVSDASDRLLALGSKKANAAGQSDSSLG